MRPNAGYFEVPVVQGKFSFMRWPMDRKPSWFRRVLWRLLGVAWRDELEE